MTMSTFHMPSGHPYVLIVEVSVPLSPLFRKVSPGYEFQQYFLDLFPLAKISRINKWDYIQLKRFYMAKEIWDEIKRYPAEWEKIFIHNVSDKG